MQQFRVSVEAILKTAGFTNPTLLHDARAWRRFRATYAAPIRTFEEEILFLGSSCTYADLENARAALRGKLSFPDLSVLMRNSAAVRMPDFQRIRTILGVQRVMTVSEFLFGVVERALGPSSDLPNAISDYGLQYFVEPSVRLANSADDQAGSAILRNWLLGKSHDDFKVAVLLAPAGNGKSTLALELYRQLIGLASEGMGQKLLPLLVTREQWAMIAQRVDLGLKEIWAAAITDRYPDAILGPEQVMASLACGTISPIFDGLDELCSFFPGDFAPTDTVEQLLSMFLDSKLLLTSRDLYWQENIAPATQAKVLQIDLRPFSAEQRTIYIGKRFGDNPERRDRAYKIFDRLSQKVRTPGSATSGTDREPHLPNKVAGGSAQDRIDLIPFVVMLVAESADADSFDVANRYGKLLSGDDPLYGLLLAFCDREKERHKMITEPMKQIEIFEMLAAEFPDGFSWDEFDLVAGMVLPEIQEAEIGRFRKHAFFKAVSRERVVFRFSFVPEYLSARTVCRWFVDGSGGAPVLKILDNKSNVADRCAELIQATVGENWEEVARSRWRFVSTDSALASGYFHLVLRLARHAAGGIRTGTVEAVLRTIGNVHAKKFMGLRVRGIVGGLDLSGVTFESCRFEDIELSCCVVDQRTRFCRCEFVGLLKITNNDNFQLASFDELCTFSLAARTSLQRELGRSKRLPITEEQVRSWLFDALRRFRRGVGAFVTRKDEGVRGGLKDVTPHANQVLEVLVKHEVLEEFRNGRIKMLRVSNTHDARVFLENGSAVGRLKTALDHLVRQVCH